MSDKGKGKIAGGAFFYTPRRGEQAALGESIYKNFYLDF
jgi:hypothetical protein